MAKRKKTLKDYQKFIETASEFFLEEDPAFEFEEVKKFLRAMPPVQQAQAARALIYTIAAIANKDNEFIEGKMNQISRLCAIIINVSSTFLQVTAGTAILDALDDCVDNPLGAPFTATLHSVHSQEIH